ncbi:MAG: Methionine--tRNA ligase [Verrucomicrobia bacterium ADurb.Bin345]|nr:MAG: Methionine--tRNA ligase [Verrucomicrobia bacterium ADurb.Bin345]
MQYIEEHPKFIQPDSRRNETLGFLRKPLNDLCISRPKSRMSWGIDLPFDKDYVCYVWFDALVNYISGVGYLADDKMFKKWWPASYHLIGKDILTTHTVYWPTMLKAMGVEQPETIFAHGWWLSGDSKMSKSLGNVVNPMDMIAKSGVDAFRYFVMAEMALGQDASFTEDVFTRRYNADLANDLGNLLSRLVNMMERHCGGRIPDAPAKGAEGDAERGLREAAQATVVEMEKAIEEMRIQDGLSAVIGTVRSINRYLEVKQPWTLAKEGKAAELGGVLYSAADALRIAAGLLYPVMPGKMAELRKALGMGDGEPELKLLRQFGVLKSGVPVQQPPPLFPRIVAEEKVVEKKPDAAPEGTALIEYTDFTKVQLRTARITQAEKIPGATKLLKLEVAIDEEKRQMVAGIALHYEPEQLIGKTVVVVANLKPAKIRGVESNGMLLAASKGETLRLVTVDGDISSGAVVK